MPYAIKEVVNIYPEKRGQGQKKQPVQTVLTKTSQVQQKLMERFDIKVEKTLF